MSHKVKKSLSQTNINPSSVDQLKPFIDWHTDSNTDIMFFCTKFDFLDISLDPYHKYKYYYVTVQKKVLPPFRFEERNEYTY